MQRRRRAPPGSATGERHRERHHRPHSYAFRLVDLASLNGPQRDGVTHPGGPLLLLAGAGSGKTRVLTMRIARLILEDGVPPDGILALTFTNKAAREMRGRIRELLGTNPRGLWVGTFHAIATRILRAEPEATERLLGIRPGFVIFDEADARALLKRTMADLELDPKEQQPAALAAAISLAQADARAPERGLGLVHERYQTLARESNGIDFDGLLSGLARLLTDDPEVGERWAERFTHVLVDEYQDTNRAQYRLLRLLTRRHGNLTVVGDDDQSIYGFRGADVRNLIDFRRDHPEARIVKLEQNYRSTQAILDIAHGVISRNPERMAKRLWSDRGDGYLPRLLLSPDDQTEAAFVATEILHLRDDAGWSLSDQAILFRTNAQSRPYERALVERRIPYHLVGGLRFWDRREIKDAVAYLRFASNPRDAVAFDRIANVPRRRISDRTAQAAIQAASDRGESILDVCLRADQVAARADARQALAGFGAAVAPIVREAGTRRPSELVQLVIRYANLADHYDDGSPGAAARLDNLAELRALASDYDRLPAPQGLERMLTDIALISDADEGGGTRDEVTLITLHMAKGLEYPVVFLTGLEDKVLPHERAFEEAGGLEEERRLCYVGMTRARRRLYLTSTAERTIFNKTLHLSPSQFLYDVPADRLELVALKGHRAQALAARVRAASAQAG
jgi:DNA helicase II / ATP-dependent DNA helicase PcrA